MMLDNFSGKDVGNLFWQFVRSQILDDNVKKIKVSDFVYDYILKLDENEYKSQYNVNLSAIKKCKAQMVFVSEIVSKLIKHAGVPLVDY